MATSEAPTVEQVQQLQRRAAALREQRAAAVAQRAAAQEQLSALLRSHGVDDVAQLRRAAEEANADAAARFAAVLQALDAP